MRIVTSAMCKTIPHFEDELRAKMLDKFSQVLSKCRGQKRRERVAREMLAELEKIIGLCDD